MTPSFMYFAFRYSVRNLARHRRRTILTLATVGATLAISMVASRYADALIGLWKNGAVDTGTAHVQFHKEGFWEKQEGIDTALMLKYNNELEQRLGYEEKVEAKVRRLRFEGLIANDLSSTFFLGDAVEPEHELLVSPLMFNPPHDEGEFVSAQNPNGVTIGRGLARLLQLNVGDQATLIAQTGGGSVNAVDVAVVGIVDVPLPSFSKHALYVNLALAQKLMRLPESYNELAVRLKPGVDTFRFVRRYGFLTRGMGIETRGWWDVEPLISKIEAIWRTIAGVLCFLLLVSTALTVVNVIFMTVNERIVEIGTLMAIGAKPWMVRTVFAVEGAVIGIAGGGLGCVLGNLCVGVMGAIGIPFESPFGSGIEMVHPSNDLFWTLSALSMATVSCAICSIPPANRAVMVDPVLAFRNIT